MLIIEPRSGDFPDVFSSHYLPTFGWVKGAESNSYSSANCEKSYNLDRKEWEHVFVFVFLTFFWSFSWNHSIELFLFLSSREKISSKSTGCKVINKIFLAESLLPHSIYHQRNNYTSCSFLAQDWATYALFNFGFIITCATTF